MNAVDSPPQAPVLIIGAGMAGLTCACYLHRAGRPVLLLEAADAVGGRVRTDLTPDGFRLDHGFQILLTKYPEVQRLIDYGALQLQLFTSGAVIRLPDGRQTTLRNPLRQPLRSLSAATAPIGSWADKLRLVSLAQHVKQHSAEELLARPATDTLSFLRRYGWSEQMIETFFRPFFGGIYLDRELTTASNFFEFVFKQFVEGDAALPARGMQEIPRQLAARLPADAVQLHTRVAAIDGNTVRLTDGRVLQGSAVVLATDGPAAHQLLPALTANEPTASRRTTCTYFAADGPSPGRGDKLLRLSAAPGALAHNVAFPSDVAPEYAPAGQALISVSTHGAHGLGDDALAQRLRQELTNWFGAAANEWRRLGTYHIEHALPVYEAGPAREAAQPPRRLAEGLYRCGDWAAYPSLNAAMATGREVAEAILGA
ncbi:protoporphyrinogen/coproporphyrinogen oxidase [Hymenobacter jeollabukensis]|uniref:FAD-dependent oxidoreductase n=1 Tax=Hymenobacter jeollabukensis TaxID=2025313 RepID=A0A5R8WUJ3_9BACT|nr:NAD(P)/FAD-dependent oxidoreductase [Hymenobacter jeollabukensis]TLM95126.1 FAD-dependent oxidoreductase [Hymenobacter jeollabukensis]